MPLLVSRDVRRHKKPDGVLLQKKPRVPEHMFLSLREGFIGVVQQVGAGVALAGGKEVKVFLSKNSNHENGHHVPI